ncbi:MAG: hypothetical protein VKJ24_05900, partial [Synechococcales bacterium]|nr:hypothetical protein [Synechococcales bacterium]
LKIEEYIVLDVLVGHAVRIAWLAEHPHHEASYAEHKANAWHKFYTSSPYDCAKAIAQALQFLTSLGESGNSETGDTLGIEPNLSSLA